MARKLFDSQTEVGIFFERRFDSVNYPVPRAQGVKEKAEVIPQDYGQFELVCTQCGEKARFGWKDGTPEKYAYYFGD